MLFSDPAIAKLCGDTFECAWESVRPVPRAEIDFGNGRKLTRTLNGNVATYFCTPEGRVLDIVPGLVTPAEFKHRAERAAKLYTAYRGFGERVVRGFHERLAPKQPARGPLQLRLRADVRKFDVEHLVKKSLASVIAPGPKHDPNHPLAKDTDYNRRVRGPKVHRLLARRTLPVPAEITKLVYRDILGVDLDDPYLGLAPYVLGGELGRRGD